MCHILVKLTFSGGVWLVGSKVYIYNISFSTTPSITIDKDGKFSTKELYTEIDIYYFFLLKITIFPRKVRHVSARRNVHLRPTANYLHIDILDQNLKKV